MAAEYVIALMILSFLAGGLVMIVLTEVMDSHIDKRYPRRERM